MNQVSQKRAKGKAGTTATEIPALAEAATTDPAAGAAAIAAHEAGEVTAERKRKRGVIEHAGIVELLPAPAELHMGRDSNSNGVTL